MISGDGEYCTYCKREMVAYSDTHPTRDHVTPKSMGGTRTVWCCTTCNGIKSNMLPSQWQRYMNENPRWWIGRESTAFCNPCPVLVMVSQFFYERRYGVWRPRPTRRT